MDKTLSQQEIDALINAISSGTVEPEELAETGQKRNIKNYDFRRPNKFSKDHVHAIKSIYDNYSRTLSNILSNQMRANVEMTVVSIEQISYGEFIRSIPNPTLMGIFSMEPLNGLMVLEANPNFGFQIVDLLCGGTLRKNIDLRGFTEIEISILEDVITMMIGKNKDSWNDFLDLEPIVNGIVTNPQLNQIYPYEEAVILITFKMQINDEQSLINMCIPYSAFGRYIDKLHTNHYNVAEKMTSELRYRSDIEQIINKGQVDMRVELGKTEITVDDFMNLRCGDVLQLDILAGEPMKLYVEDSEHFYVQPGLHKNKLAVQVVEYAGKEVE
jgi:flagellar motor switch protein FliM